MSKRGRARLHNIRKHALLYGGDKIARFEDEDDEEERSESTATDSDSDSDSGSDTDSEDEIAEISFRSRDRLHAEVEFEAKSECFRLVFGAALRSGFDEESAIELAGQLEGRGFYTRESLYDASDDEWWETCISQALRDEIIASLESETACGGADENADPIAHPRENLDLEDVDIENKIPEVLPMSPTFDDLDIVVPSISSPNSAFGPGFASEDSDLDMQDISQSTLESMITIFDRCLPRIGRPQTFESFEVKARPPPGRATVAEIRGTRAARRLLHHLGKREHSAWTDLEFEAHAMAKHVWFEFKHRRSEPRIDIRADVILHLDSEPVIGDDDGEAAAAAAAMAVPSMGPLDLDKDV